MSVIRVISNIVYSCLGGKIHRSRININDATFRYDPDFPTVVVNFEAISTSCTTSSFLRGTWLWHCTVSLVLELVFELFLEFLLSLGVGKKITDNHVTDKGLADPDLLAVFPFSE